jgi:trimeric autotransporter adhesin
MLSRRQFSRVGQPGAPPRRVRTKLVLMAALTWWSGCEGCDRSTAPVAVDSVEVTPAQREFTALGQTATFTAVARDANGASLNGRTTSWTSTDAAVASVNGSGEVTAAGYGSTRIMATIEGRSGGADVTVLRPLVASVTVEPGEATVLEGETVQLEASVRDAGGNLMTDREPAWSSNDPAIAAVANGVVTGVRAGAATITATLDGQSGVATVTVAPQPVASVTVEPATATIEAGTSIELAALVRDAQNRILAGRTVTWSSANAAVATVDAAGNVTGVAGGTVTITAASEGKAGTATITVLPRPVTSVVIQPNAITVGIGATTQLTAEARAGDGTLLDGRSFTWSSNAPAIAGTDDMGRVIAIAAGVATITATSEGVSGAAVVTVVHEPVASVVVTPATANTPVGGTVQLSAQTLDGTGAPLLGRPVAWSSANTAIATVDADGTVSGSAPGTVVITAASEGKTGTATITVQPVLPQSITITPASATIALGGTVQLQAVARDAGGNAIPGKTFTWTGSACATANTNGLVTGVALGTCTVTATVDGVVASATITVVQVPIATVTVDPTAATVKVGGMSQLTAAAFDANGAPLAGRTFTWTTSDDAVATVDATGKVSGVSTGMATITATSEGKSAAAVITVVIPPVATVAVNPATATVTVNGMVQLAAQAQDADGDPIAGKTFTWTTSDGTIAIVDATGKVTGVAQGSATITATSDGQSGSAAVTVQLPLAQSITVTPATGTVVIGSTLQLAAQAYDSNANPISGKTFTWTGAVCASSDATGLVTGVALGTCTVTAAADGVSGNSTITVVDVPIVTATVTPVAATVKVGGTTQLVAAAFDANGSPLTGRAFTWTTSEGTVAAVDPSGNVTGVSPGIATVTATAEGKSATSTITVVIPPVASVVVAPATANLTVNGMVQLSAEARDADGDPIAGKTFTWTTSDGGVATVDATGKVTGVAQGTATITATSEGQSGSSNLTVQTGSVGEPLMCGSLATASISTGAEVDVYSFTGQAGARIALTIGETGGGFVFVGARPVVTLFAPGGATIESLGANAQSLIDLPASGTYVLRVNASDLATTGNYGMGIECMDPPVPEEHLALGTNVAANVAAGAQVDLYTFTGQAGAQVTITLAETGGGFVFVGARPVVTLIGADRTIVTSFGANAQETVTLPLSGTYVLKVDASDYVTTGGYRLDVQSLLPTEPVDAALSSGGHVGGTLASAQVDVYTIDATAGDQLAITLAETGGGFVFVGARPVVDLIDATGASVSTFGANEQNIVTIPTTGMYILRVNASDFVTTGNYQLDVQSIAPATPTDGSLVCNAAAIAGSIGSGAKVDLYGFTAPSPLFATIVIAETGGGFVFVGAHPVATLFAADGTPLGEVHANGQNTFSIPAGTYSVKVDANDRATTGTYSVSLQCL